MTRSPIGSALIVAGVLTALAGALVWLGVFSWFGRLPGDIRIERGNSRIYVPLVSMLLVSVAISLLASLVRWLAQKH
jgi:hypothetical protein